MREGEENERIIRERETEGVAHLFGFHTADAGKQGLQMRDARQVEARAHASAHAALPLRLRDVSS
jgi:hypothetical protein